MAKLSKTKRRNFLFFMGGAILFIFIGVPMISIWRLRGTWNGKPWADIQRDYPGINVSLFGSKVTVPGRSDLVGTLSKDGNSILWGNGQTWSKS